MANDFVAGAPAAGCLNIIHSTTQDLASPVHILGQHTVIDERSMKADANNKSKRYVLCKKEGDTVKPCAFFNTPMGCRTGSACPFSHGTTSTDAVTSTVLEKKRKDDGVVTVDSEKVEKKHKKSRSEKTRIHKADEASTKPTTHVPVTHVQADTTPFVPFSPPGFSMSKAKNDEDSDDSQFLFSAVNTALTQGEISSPMPISFTGVSSMSHQHALSQAGSGGSKPTEVPGTDFFLPNHAVHRILETSGTEHATHGKVQKKRKSKSPAPKAVSQVATPATSEYPFAIPAQQQRQPGNGLAASTPIRHTDSSQAPSGLDRGLPIAPALFQAPIASQPQPQAARPPPSQNGGGIEGWLPLVQHSLQAGRYQSEYKFDKDSEWVSSKPFGDWYVSLLYPLV